MPDHSDLDLIAQLNAGHPSAFETLYHRHKDWVYRLAFRFTHNEADAQDTTQEVFIYLAKKFPGLTLTASLTTLLYPAVKHTALALRKKRQRTTSTTEEIEANLTAPPQAPDPLTQRTDLAAALSILPDSHREVLLMRFVDDMQLDEIASALQIPLGTAKSRLHHALKSLRENPTTQKFFSPE